MEASASAIVGGQEFFFLLIGRLFITDWVWGEFWITSWIRVVGRDGPNTPLLVSHPELPKR